MKQRPPKNVTIERLRELYFSTIDECVERLGLEYDEDDHFDADDYAAFVGTFLVDLGAISAEERTAQIKRVSDVCEAVLAG